MTASPYVYRSPDQVLADLAIVEPSEIDLEVVAQYCGATVVYEPLEGCEAYIIGRDDRAIIAVNSTAYEGRQRFSIGHELGHWMRDRGTRGLACDKRKMSMQWRHEEPENLANLYAADLLFPLQMFVPRAKGKPVTFETARALAGEFRGSLTAVAIRLVQHGSFPSMLVYCENGKKRWSIRGDDIYLKLREEPGPNSMAYDLLRGTNAAHAPTDVYADEWIEKRNADRYSVREHSIRSGAGVLTLLWWKDERIFTDR